MGNLVRVSDSSGLSHRTLIGLNWPGSSFPLYLSHMSTRWKQVVFTSLHFVGLRNSF